MKTLSMARRSSALSRISSRISSPPPPAAVEQRVGHRLGLLVHLLGHEVLVAALLRRLDVPRDGELLGLDRRPVERASPQASPGVSTASSSSASAKTLTRVPDQRRDVRRQAAPCRRASPSTSGVVRRAATIVSGSSAETTAMENAPRTRRNMERVASASGRPVGHALLDQVRHHLGVGGRGQRVPGRLELGPQLGVVLDDAVVDDGQAARAVDVRVGVLRGGAPVGGPAGVPDGGVMARRRVGGQLGQLGHRVRPAGRPHPPDAAARAGRRMPPRRPPWRCPPSRSPGTPAGAGRRGAAGRRRPRR